MGIPAPLGVAASGKPPPFDQANAVLSGQIGAIGPGQAFAFRGPMNLSIWASINTALTTTADSLDATVASGTGLAAGDAISSSLVPLGTTAGVVSGTDVTLAPPTITLEGLLTAGLAQIAGLAETAGLLGAAVSGPGIPSGVTVIGIVQAAVAPTPGLPDGTTGIVELSAAPSSVPIRPGQQPFNFALTAAAIPTGTDDSALFTGAAISYDATIQLERSFDGGSTWIVCNIDRAGTLAKWATGTPVSQTFGEPEKNVLYRLNCTAYTSGVINYRISQTGGAAESLAIGPLSGG